MKPVLLFLLLCPAFHTRAQDSIPVFKYREIKSTDILLGIHWQGNTRDNTTFRYYEIGIGKGRYSYHRHGVTGGAVYVSEEMYFGREKNIFGTKLGAWFHWLVDLGMAMVYYTDLEKGNLKIRPELGFGMGRTRAVFGFNVPTIGNKKFEELRRNTVQASLQTTIGVHKKIKRI